MSGKNKNAPKKSDAKKDGGGNSKSGSGVSVKVRHILCEKQVIF